MVLVILNSTADLGFNPLNVVKSVARVGTRVVTDPRVQRAAVSAGQAYAPGQYAYVTAAANRAQQVYRQYGQMPPQPMPPPGMMMPGAGDVAVAPDESAVHTPGQTVQSSHLLLGGVVVAGILLVLIMKR